MNRPAKPMICPMFIPNSTESRQAQRERSADRPVKDSPCGFRQISAMQVTWREANPPLKVPNKMQTATMPPMESTASQMNIMRAEMPICVRR